MNVQPIYTTEILRLAASIPDPVSLDRIDGSAELRSPTCGSRVLTEVQLDADGRIERLNQKVQACAFGQASAAIVAAQAAGRTSAEIDAALAGLADWLAEDSPLPEGWQAYSVLEPAQPRSGRHGAILLPMRALLAAIEGAGR